MSKIMLNFVSKKNNAKLKMRNTKISYKQLNKVLYKVLEWIRYPIPNKKDLI